MLRPRLPSPPLILSSVALFMALGGGAYAAVSSDTKQDKQIANSAVKAYFKSHISGASVSHANIAETANTAINAINATSATSAISANSATSATTAANVTGISGPLASGETEIGTFAMSGNSPGFLSDDAITFPIPLGSAPQEDVVPLGGPGDANCPGSAASPSAAPGFLCYYISKENGASGIEEITTGGFPSKYGDVIFPTGTSTNTNYQLTGQWAVTG